MLDGVGRDRRRGGRSAKPPMIISHRHRFVFLHVPKTAGTTVATFFASTLGPRDTMLGSWKEARAHGAKINLRTLAAIRRYQSPARTARTLLRDGNLDSLIGRSLRHRFERSLWDHSSAEQIEKSEPVAWNRYFKFCFVRNPFTRMVSLYNWHFRDAVARPSFSEMLRLIDEGGPGADRFNWQSWPLYTKDNRVVVDFIGRQEQLVDGMKIICDRLNMRFDERSVRRGKALSQDADLGSYYRPGDREIVARLFAPEIEHFGYQFPA